MFMLAWPVHSFPVGSWLIFRILLSAHGIQACCGLKYLMAMWSDHLVSFSPIRIYLFSEKLLLTLRSQLRISSSKKPGPCRLGHCGGMGNKNGPRIKFHSGFPWVQRQTKKTDHHTNKQIKNFPLWEETLIWQSKDKVLGRKGLRKDRGRRGCFVLLLWN